MLYFSDFGVERRAFDEPHFAANHVVARRGVAEKVNAIDEGLLALLHAHDDVHRRLSWAGQRTGRRFHRRQVGESCEFEGTPGAVDFPRLDQAGANRLVAVPVPGLQLVERLQELGLDDSVALEGELTTL